MFKKLFKIKKKMQNENDSKKRVEPKLKTKQLTVGNKLIEK